MIIGEGNDLERMYSIGMCGASKGEYHPGKIHMGDRNQFYDLTIVYGGSTRMTKIGNDNRFLARSHIGHDVHIGDNNVIGALSLLCGYSEVGNNVHIGAGTLVHQGRIIGDCVMTGLGSVVVHDIPPFLKVAGNPARIIGVNEIGMQRAGYSEDKIKIVVDFYQTFELTPFSEEKKNIVDFIKNAKKPLTQWKKDTA